MMAAMRISQRARSKAKDKEDDVHNLEQKFYRYGIKPEWLQPHRIINHTYVIFS